MCFPGWPALRSFKLCRPVTKQEDVRCSAELETEHAEPTVMRTLVACAAAVVPFVQQTTDTKKVTRCALRSAELDICPNFDDSVVKTSA